MSDEAKTAPSDESEGARDHSEERDAEERDAAEDREEPAGAAPRSDQEAGGRGRGLVMFLALVAVVAGAIFVWRATRPEPLPPPAEKADLLDAVPTSPMLLVTLDLDALRGSRLGALLVSEEGAGLLGRVRATCGFEPIDALKEIALVVPASSDDADFGLVAVGDVNQAAIVDCAEKVISLRGGKPVASALGTFRAVRDAGTASGEIAVRAGGPLLVGAGNYLRTMVDTADGALPTVRTDSAHAALRAAIADVPLARASIVLSPKQRATIADEVRRSGGRAPSSLTAVLAAAVGAKITPETVQVHGVVLVEDPARAKELAEAFDALRKERADDPLLRLLGLGQLLDRVRLQLDGSQMHVHLELTIAEAEMIADKLAALRDARDEPPPSADSALPAGVPSSSDVAPSSSPGAAASAAPSASASPTIGKRHEKRAP